MVRAGAFYCCAVALSAETISIEPAPLRRTSFLPPPLIVPLSESSSLRSVRDRQIAADAAGAGLRVDRQAGVRRRHDGDAAAGSFEAHVIGDRRRAESPRSRSARSFGVQFSADVGEAKFAAAAVHFRVADAVQDGDVAAGSVGIEVAAAVGDFNLAAAGVEMRLPVAILHVDVAAAGVGVNVAVDLAESSDRRRWCRL